MTDGAIRRLIRQGLPMRRLTTLAVGLALMTGGIAMADEPTKPPVAEDAIALSPVALPIIVDGHLANYVFVSVKVWLTPHADLLSLRDKEPYLRDALVRAGHRTPFVVKGDLNRIDEAKLSASLQRDAVAIIGPGLVKNVQVVSQTPQHRLPSSH